ncbi:MAG: ATP-binding cassette domain-containing protein [Treponema sp.]|nr:ATP-binding cassette domain-containing protein [Treponema sp.]
MSVVEFDNFSIALGERYLLKTTNLKFEKGSSNIIVGQTGSGKSVLLKTIAGVLPLNTFKYFGDLKINNFQAYNNGKKAKRKIWHSIEKSGLAFIPAETAQVMNPSLTLEQNLSVIAPNSKELISDQLLKYFSMDFKNFARNYPDELSGGQMQRITLMILLNRPSSIILLDEPTVNLDRDLRSQFAIFLNEEILDDTSKTLIMVSHDLDFISKLNYSYLYELRDGVIEKTEIDKIRIDVDKKNDIELKETENKIVFVNVSQTYIKRTVLSEKKFVAFKDLSFQLYESVIYGITGPSGCGKTSVVKAILRLLNGTKGCILYSEEDLVALKPNETGKDPEEFKLYREKMSIVQQDSRFSFIPDLKLRDSIQEIIKYHKDTTMEDLIENMEKVGLSAVYLDKFPQNFSSGEIKRLDIALALSFKPKLLVLDEPFAHIDIETRSIIMNFIKEFITQNKLFLIIITHEDFDLKYFVEKNFDFETLVRKIS